VRDEALTRLAGREVAVTAGVGDRTPVLEVQPGAERAAGAGEDRDLAAVVGRDRVERVVQLADETEVDGVQPVRPVQPDGRAVFGGRFQLDGRHGAPLAVVSRRRNVVTRVSRDVGGASVAELWET